MTGDCQCVQRAKFIQEPCSLRPLRYWLTMFGCSCSFVMWAWLQVSRLVSVLIYSLARFNDCDTKMQTVLKEKHPQSRPWMSNNLVKLLFFSFKIKLFYSPSLYQQIILSTCAFWPFHHSGNGWLSYEVMWFIRVVPIQYVVGHLL